MAEINQIQNELKKIDCSTEFLILSRSESLEPRHKSYVEYLKSLLPILNTIELLEHQQYIKQKVRRC